MTTPALHSLAAEEALVAGLLLHDPAHLVETFERFDDADLFYEHIRPIVTAAREVFEQTGACDAVTVCVRLGSLLDELSWKGLRAEELVMDITGRHVLDVSAMYTPLMANIVHQYAERRKAWGRAQEETAKAYGDLEPEVATREAGAARQPRYEDEV